LVIFAIFIALAFLSNLVLKQDEESGLLIGSTYSTKPKGCKAFYLLLKEMGFNAKRWQFPLRTLKEDPKKGQVMLVIDTRRLSGGYGYSSGSKSKLPDFPHLFDWVRRGNTLLLIGNSSYLHSKRLKTMIFNTGVGEFLEERRYDEIDEADRGKKTFKPSLPTFYCRGVDKIKLSEYLRFNCERDDKLEHFQDDKGQVVISLAEGEGKVILISDSYIINNEGVGKADNVYLLSNMIANESVSGTVYFDEFDHGFSSQRGLFDYFKGTPLVWICLQFFLVSSVYFYSKGKYFGAPRPLPKGRRRSVLEYVDAMAAIFQKAQAYQPGLAGIYRRYKALWLKALGFEARTDIEELSLVIAGKINRDKLLVEKVLTDCEEVLGGRPVRKEAALSLAKELQKLRKELEDAGVSQ